MNQIGRYQVLDELGRGAYGVVYRALDPAIGRTIAIKSIRFADLSDSAERRKSRNRVLREAQSAGKLSHPNIVTIYDVLESDEMAYIFMEYVDGLSLKDAMVAHKLPGRSQMLVLLRQIAEALDYAHRKGIVHRDIKPANIMISTRGFDNDEIAKIADFGIAKLVSQDATHQRALIGTPGYMSPEQLEGVPVGGASDQFALGVIVYELLTGEKPFAADNLSALHYFICKRPARPPHELNPALTETVGRVMDRVLAKSAEDRYSNCSEFVGALGVALGECPDWAPLVPKQIEEPISPGGNAWYAPETAVSARSATSNPAASSTSTDTAPLIPDVLPPDPVPAEVAFAKPAPSPEIGTRDAVANPEPIILEGRRTVGTRIKFEPAPEPATRRSWGWTVAACAGLTLLGILLLRGLSSNPSIHAHDGDAPRVLNSSSEPEDLNAPPSAGAATPTDPKATPNASNASSTPPTAAPPVVPQSNHSDPTVTAVDTAQARPTVTARVADASTPLEKSVTPPAPAASGLSPDSIEKVAAPASRHLPSPPKLPPEVSPKPAEPPVSEPADVELSSDPPGAHVEVDGRDDLSCLTPCSVPLTPGRHTLSANSDGYGVAKKIFAVPSEGSVFVSLTRNIGTLVLTSQPGGANVVIDGKSYGPTPVRIRLSAGRHHLSVSDGVHSHDETIEIDVDGVYARSFRWEP